MFGELPKLLGKSFALGFFLPSIIYVVGSLYLFERHSFFTAFLTEAQRDLLIGTTAIGLISWLAGILLLGANRSIYRLLEGYGKYNPLQILLNWEKRKYVRLINELDHLDAKYIQMLKDKEEISFDFRKKRNQVMQDIAEKIPDKLEFVLPTSFGNIIRAFEVYPRIVYGIESIQGWNRLLAVISKEYLDLIDDAKTQVDFWVNLGLLSLLFIFQYICLWIYTGEYHLFLLPLLAIVLAIVAASRAESAAVQWGELIKSAFDVFLPKLKKELELINSIQEERNIWTRFSQVIIYRLPSMMQEIKSESDTDQKNVPQS
jgi:hypothetical protein